MSTYSEHGPSRESEQTSKNVKISLENEFSTSTRIDPATPWVVLNSELNDQLGLRVRNGSVIKLRTAVGVLRGSLDRHQLL